MQGSTNSVYALYCDGEGTDHVVSTDSYPVYLRTGKGKRPIGRGREMCTCADMVTMRPSSAVGHSNTNTRTVRTPGPPKIKIKGWGDSTAVILLPEDWSMRPSKPKRWHGQLGLEPKGGC